MRSFAIILALLAALIGLILGVPNTDTGRRLIAQSITSASAGQVAIEGLSGRFPDSLHIAKLSVADAQGPWLTIENAALDWSPTKLLSRLLQIDRLTATRVAVARLPTSSGSSSTSSGPISLPVRIALDLLKLDRVELAAPVAGIASVLSVDGHVSLASLSAGAGEFTIHRLDTQATYHATATLDADRLAAHIDLTEPPHGLIATLADLPDIGAIDAKLDTAGPWTAAQTSLTLAAGELRATATGRIDIHAMSGDIDLTATAPAMTPRPGLTWTSIALKAHATGPATTPRATGTLTISGLSTEGASFTTLAADLGGDPGTVTANIKLDGLRLPGPQPDLFASDPLTLRTTIRLDQPDRPVTFALAHKYLAAEGSLRSAGTLGADFTLTLPDLSPARADVAGNAKLDVHITQRGEAVALEIDGHLGLTAAPTPIPALLGPDAAIGVSATIQGENVTLSRLKLDGQTAALTATGAFTAGQMALDTVLSLSNLAKLTPSLSGATELRAHLEGPPDSFTARADLTGTLGTTGFPAAPVALHLNATGLPNLPAGDISATATLDGAPLALAATADRTADGALHLNVSRADWKTAHAEIALTLPPGADLPNGHAILRLTRLDDLRTLIGQPLSGGIEATLDIDDKARAKLALDAKGIAPLDRLQLQAEGPQNALAIKLTASGAGTSTTAAATLDAPAQTLTLTALQSDWQSERLRLQAPARISFADGIRIDRLSLALREAVLTLAGRITPTLDVTASLRNLPAGIASIFAPDLQMDGTLSADARLTGNPATPSGTVTVAAQGLRLKTGPASAFPPGTLQARATLAGRGTAQLDVRATLATSTLSITGTAPLDPSGAMNLRATAAADLALLDPILTPHGQRARGHLSLDAALTGKPTAPVAEGTIRLTQASFEDSAQGLRLSAIDALLRGSGDSVVIERLTAKAGAGTLSASGRIGLTAPMPIDISLTARKASPLATDTLNVVLDADLTLQGSALGALLAGGTVRIASADIRIPERLPATVAVLNVRRPGDKPVAPPTPGPEVALDLAIEAPGRVFVRGRGLDAELQGSLRLRGTAAAPRAEGALKLRRGQFNLVGKALAFTTGEVSLDGSGRMDPTLHFIASNTANSVTSKLEITGYASAPKIALSAIPELPQDEVLARLLFGQSAASLGPLQLAQIAAGLAQLSGVGGGFNPLEKLRAGLGLDRLNVGNAASGQGTTVEAGRNLAEGVYVGARQGTAGTGTQAVVQIDIGKGVKLEATVGTSSGGSQSATGAAGSTGGTSVGLTYGFDY